MQQYNNFTVTSARCCKDHYNCPTVDPTLHYDGPSTLYSIIWTVLVCHSAHCRSESSAAVVLIAVPIIAKISGPGVGARRARIGSSRRRNFELFFALGRLFARAEAIDNSKQTASTTSFPRNGCPPPPRPLVCQLVFGTSRSQCLSSTTVCLIPRS